MKKEYFVLIVGFIVAIVFRFWFISISPQFFGFDQFDYHTFALQMIKNGVYAESARLYGYPIFLAIMYKFIGFENLQAIYVFQAIADSMTAIIVYQWAKLLFNKKSVSWVAFVLYIFNPYTSAYVGMILSEVTGIFFTALLLYFFTLFWLKKKIIVFLIFSFVAGFLPQIRPAFLYFAVGLFFISVYIWWKEIKLRYIGIALFILPFLYVLLGNVMYFDEWKLTNVDRVFPRELFISIIVPNRLSDDVRQGRIAFPKEVTRLYKEYSVKPKNQKERTAMAHVYFAQSMEIIKKNPWQFIRERFGKMFFVWEKHFLFYYEESPNTLRDQMVYWGNMILLMSGLSGLLVWFVKKRSLLAVLYASFIIYISIIHSFSLAEERYSLPGYPLLFLFAGYTLDQLYRRSFITPNKE